MCTKWLNMCNQHSQKKNEKCKMTEWAGLLEMLGHQNQDSLPIAENYEGTKQKISVGRINDCIS